MYLGIDLGTSGVKAILVDESQTHIASADAPLTLSHPHTGWSEQDPQTWIAATKAALAQLRANHPTAYGVTRSIGLSGQMHGATLLDASDTPLRPAILWNDTRAHAEAAALDAQPKFRARTGNIVFPGFTAPKLLWTRTHEPQVFANTRKVLLPKDYLRLWLTGLHVSDMSDASGTSWLNVENRRWDTDLLAACDLPETAMPDLVEGSDVSGTLRPALAAELGLPKTTTVAGGAGDNAAAAIASGTIHANDTSISLGTSGTIFVAGDAYRPNPASAVHAFCHALPGRWHQMGVILSATAALNWFAGITGQTAPSLVAELGGTLHPPTPALFLPYLAGERTPLNDAHIRGSFHNLSAEMGRAHLTQAVLEGIAFALKDNLIALQSAGSAPQSATITGGGANAPYWVKLIATVLNLPIQIPAKGSFGAAAGAAHLAMLADGLGSPAEICTPLKAQMTFEPDRTKQPAFDAAFERYKAASRTNE